MVYLSNTEYGILEHLARHLGQNVSKASILESVWDDTSRDPNVVEVYIRFLRNKLERGGAKRLIYTVRGRGYCLSNEPIAE
jgi:DNA-binding response OmpR family regulator